MYIRPALSSPYPLPSLLFSSLVALRKDPHRSNCLHYRYRGSFQLYFLFTLVQCLWISTRHLLGKLEANLYLCHIKVKNQSKFYKTSKKC